MNPEIVAFLQSIVRRTDYPKIPFRGCLSVILTFSAESKRHAHALPPGAVVSYAEAEAEFEKRTLETALRAADGQIAEAARMLRISRATFYKKLAKFDLATPAAPVQPARQESSQVSES